MEDLVPRRQRTDALVAGVRGGQNTVVMPDGPHGPRRRARPGAALTAAATGIPLVPLRFEAKRCWNLGGWDQKQLPIPFVSRWTLTVGAPIAVEPGKEAAATSAMEAALDG